MSSSAKLASQIAQSGSFHPSIIEAIQAIDRLRFVPEGFKRHAYTLDALPMQANQWLSSPLTVAKMTQALEPWNADSVLEIGCGSGYQAAILSRIVRRVFTIERIERLLLQARLTFKELNLTNINTRLDDGTTGWREFAPFDRILFSAALPAIPEALIEQLSPKGIIVAPITHGHEQIITRFVKYGRTLTATKLESCRFVPIVHGIEKHSLS
ncbi:MAG: protein-L-isoaspartate(D-aspartate) O-methyltransferase [Campylobacterales bacterium]